MRPSQPPGVLLVAARELRWMRRDGVALFLAIGIPLIAFAILAWTFSNAVIRDLRVTVIDLDRSSTSASFIQAIDATPGVSLAERATDLSEAMRAIRAGAAIAALYIPANFERDLLAERQPQIVVFHNIQYFTPGNSAGKSLRDAVNAAMASLAPSSPAARATAVPGALVVEQYVLTNPALNYAQFLLRAILPTVLHVVMAITAGYLVGSEFGRRSMASWARAAGGAPLTALVGKLLPLLGIFILMLVVGLIVIDGLFQVSFKGDVVMMVAAAIMLVIAYTSLGALIQLLVRNLALGLSLTAIICSPAFGFAGVGFPVAGMEAFPRFWGGLLPLRWYIQVLFDQAARGVPTSASVEPFVTLGGIAIVLFLLAWLRLRAVLHQPPVSEPAAPPIAVAPGLAGAFHAEWQRVLQDRSVFGLFVLGPVLYGFLYPQPYLGQLLRDAPIAVVDHDRTELSRSLVQALDAHEAIKVAIRADTLAEAQTAVQDRRVFGILHIPAGTQRDVLKGHEARLPAYVDSAHFFAFNRTLQGMSEASAIVASSLVTRDAREDGSLARRALAAVRPAALVVEPLYNPTGGYGSYVVPAAFVLILQQTLLMGAAMLGGVAYERGGRGARAVRGNLVTLIGQAIAHLTLYLPGLGLYLIVLPHIYGFSTLGHVLDLAAVAVPFILATSFLGQLAGAFFRRRETSVLLFVATSLPLFFMVGVSWPREAIPEAIRQASRIFPSTSAIDALVRVNQMGAALGDVRQDWMQLWIVAGLYLALAAIVTHLRREPEITHA